MPSSLRFPYVVAQNTLGESISRPILPTELTHSNQSLQAFGLVDSGADVNMLPYELGIALGLDWDSQDYALHLSGNMANYEARGVIVTGRIGNFPLIDMAFAWVRAEGVPLIFGQTNFFEAFEVCFFRLESYFTITRKGT